MRHELFERRFGVYKNIQIFLSQILQKSRVEDEALSVFYDAMQKARFLFGEDVNGYLEEIKRHAFAEKHAAARMEEIRGDRNERSKYVARRSDEIKWLGDQLDELHRKFGPYMRFSRK
jgi:uncharacterized protein YdbL (DUF1318 family)